MVIVTLEGYLMFTFVNSESANFDTLSTFLHSFMFSFLEQLLSKHRARGFGQTLHFFHTLVFISGRLGRRSWKQPQDQAEWGEPASDTARNGWSKPWEVAEAGLGLCPQVESGLAEPMASLGRAVGNCRPALLWCRWGRDWWLWVVRWRLHWGPGPWAGQGKPYSVGQQSLVLPSRSCQPFYLTCLRFSSQNFVYRSCGERLSSKGGHCATDVLYGSWKWGKILYNFWTLAVNQWEGSFLYVRKCI